MIRIGQDLGQSQSATQRRYSALWIAINAHLPRPDRPPWIGSLTFVAVWWLATLTLPLPIAAVLAAIAFAVITSSLQLIGIPRCTRLALGVLDWRGRLEPRIKSTNRSYSAPSAGDRTAHLTSPAIPDPSEAATRAIALGLAGEANEALAMTDMLPTDRPWQVFERARTRAVLNFIATGEASLAEVRSARAGLSDPRDLAKADVDVATLEARIILEAGGGLERALEPLIAARVAARREATMAFVRRAAIPIFLVNALIGGLVAALFFALLSLF
jgi:hypothetical protein